MEIFLIISVVLAYLVGSIPFGYIYGKVFKKIDIRKYGSGNLGATNVLRVLGVLPGVIVLLLDVLKGFLPVLVIMILTDSNTHVAILVGLFAVFGHTFTVFLRFKGGKGVATAAGVCFALMPYSLLGALATFLIVVVITRYVSLGSITAVISLLASEIMSYNIEKNIYKLCFVIFIVIFIIYKHKANIIRLIKGTENKISFRKRKEASCVE